jgi:hypothetical protein
MKALLRNRLFHYIDEHLDTNWQQWQHLQVIMKTTSVSPTQHALSSTLVKLLQASGIETQVLDQAQIAIYGLCRGENTRTLLLYFPIYRCHQLAPLVYSLAAVQAYQATIGHIPPTTKWLLDFGTGEQLPAIIAQDRLLLQANACLWYNEEQSQGSHPTFALGTKGKLCVALHAHTGDVPAPTIHAGVLPNALWRLLWALNSLKSPHEEILIDGFYDTVQLLPDNLTNLLYHLEDHASLFAQHWGLTEPLLGLQGWQFHYAHLLTPTCTVSNITDYASANSVSSDTQVQPRSTIHIDRTMPAEARAQLEFLLVPQQDPDDIYAKLCSHLHAQGFDDIAVQPLQSNRPSWTALQHPFVHVLQQSSSAVYGRPPYLLPLSAGSYPLEPLCSRFNMPIIQDLTATPTAEQDASSAKQHISRQIKQLVLIMDQFTEML